MYFGLTNSPATFQTMCKGTYPSDPLPPIPSASANSVYMFSPYYHLTTISVCICISTLRSDPPSDPPCPIHRTLRVLSVGPSVSYPSDPIIFIRSPSGLYSIIVRYLFILFPEPSTACPRVRPVYIRLLNTCYGFPQINSLWIPLTGQLPFPQYYI